MSLNNRLFLIYLNSLIFIELLSMFNGQLITDEKDKDCSELERQNKELLLKIEKLEKENKELREWKKKRRRKKERRRRPTY